MPETIKETKKLVIVVNTKEGDKWINFNTYFFPYTESKVVVEIMCHGIKSFTNLKGEVEFIVTTEETTVKQINNIYLP